MNDFWESLDRRSKGGLIGGAVLVLVLFVAASWWLLRTEYQVLFSDLKPQDAQAMTAELERLKIPYKLGDAGTAILVDASTVHATRIKMMGKDLPLHGAVGFELFNNTDFGMTEFAQKINYQRALQGELTRTILALAEIRDARVHLVMPEQGLFKQSTTRAKASITVSMREGEALRAEQVAGIQRLVAAAVPGMTTQDVTIVDSRGVALTRGNGAPGEQDLADGRLDLKRDTETYLSRKAGAVLDRVFGAGQALASVDVALNMEQVRVTTEDVLPAQGRGSAAATGVLVREKEITRDGAAPLDARADSKAAGSSQRETEYAVGRRVEQVIGQPGTVRRIQVVAVVRKALDATQEEQVRRMVAAAVGALPERGDLVVVQALGALVPAASAEPAASVAPAGPALTSDARPSESQASSGADRRSVQVLAAVTLLAVLMAIGYLVLRRRPANDAPALSADQRDAALRRVQAWMGSPAP